MKVLVFIFILSSVTPAHGGILRDVWTGWCERNLAQDHPAPFEEVASDILLWYYKDPHCSDRAGVKKELEFRLKSGMFTPQQKLRYEHLLYEVAQYDSRPPF